MKLIATVIFCFCSFILKAQADTFTFYQNKDLQIGKGVQILEDNTNALTLTDIVKSEHFKQYNKQVINLGVSPSTFWIQFTLFNHSNDGHLLLNVAQPTLNLAELYSIDAGGKFEVQKVGTSFPFEKRYYKHQDLLFNLNVPPH